MQDFTYRGRPADYSIEIALTGTAPQFELVEVSGKDSLRQEWIDTHGYGIQHLGMRVDDVAAITAEMTGAGYGVLQSGHGYGLVGDGAFVYVDTLADYGFILEAIEVPAQRREPDFVFPPPAAT